MMGRFFLVAMLATHAFLLWSVRGRIAKGDPDFTVFYTAGKMLREARGGQLYDPRAQQAVQREFATDSDIRQGPLPYIHPPFEALVFLPLTFLPYRDAFLVWNLLNLGMLFGIALLLRRSLRSLRNIPLWEWVLGALAFFPVFVNFLQGQDAILLLLLFVFGFCALDRDADFTAGCCFGLGVFKYHFVIPLVLVLLLWRGKRGAKLVGGFAAVASAAALLSLGIVGWHGALRYPAYTWRVVSVPGHGQTPYGLMPNLLGLVTGWPFIESVGWLLRGVALAASAGLLIAVACMRDLVNDRRFFRLSFAIAVITVVLVSYNTNAHDLSLLVLPLALLADHCAPELSRWSPAKTRMVVPVVPLLISPLWIFLWMGWGRINLMVIFLLWWIYAIRREMLRMRATGGGGVPSITASG